MEKELESDELRRRLERGLACVKRLKNQWPGRAAGGGGTPRQPAWGEMPASIGRFQIRRELGRGACGVVFLAHDPMLGREIALKLPRVDVLLEPDLRGRFALEARAAATEPTTNAQPSGRPPPSATRPGGSSSESRRRSAATPVRL